MSKSKTSSYVLTLELDLTKEQKDTIDHMLAVAKQIYNAVLNEALKRLHKVQHDRDIQALLEEKKDSGRNDATVRMCINREIRAIEQSYGYSEYDLHAFVASVKHYFHDPIGIDECQKLATRAFRAAEKVHYHMADKVHFKAWFEDMSIEGKSHKSCLKHNREAGTVSVKGIKEGIPYIVRDDDPYAMHALKDRTKYVRLLVRTVRGKKRYFVQLIQEGIPPLKGRTTKAGRVGLDEGTTTLAAVSATSVRLHELAPSVRDDERKIRLIQRAMDRSKRATNPDNYNKDGTIKPRKELKEWKFSKRYLKLRAELKDIQRKAAAKRKQDHEILSNGIIRQGNDIRVEDMKIRALQKRSKTSKKRSDGRNSSRKRFGKVIKQRAPAMLISMIDRKLKYFDPDSGVKHIDTFKVKASQYDHVTDTYTKKPLTQRYADIGGHRLQRDLYSGFLIMNTKDTLNAIDRNRCITDFNRFMELQGREVTRILDNQQKSLLWYVGYAM